MCSSFSWSSACPVWSTLTGLPCLGLDFHSLGWVDPGLLRLGTVPLSPAQAPTASPSLKHPVPWFSVSPSSNVTTGTYQSCSPPLHMSPVPTTVPGTEEMLNQYLSNTGINTWMYKLKKQVKLPAMRETWAWPLCWKGPLEKGMAAHSSILAQRIPWMEEACGLQSMG